MHLIVLLGFERSALGLITMTSGTPAGVPSAPTSRNHAGGLLTFIYDWAAHCSRRLCSPMSGCPLLQRWSRGLAAGGASKVHQGVLSLGGSRQYSTRRHHSIMASSVLPSFTAPRNWQLALPAVVKPDMTTTTGTCKSSNPRIISRQSPLSSRSCSKTGEPLQLAVKGATLIQPRAAQTVNHDARSCLIKLPLILASCASASVCAALGYSRRRWLALHAEAQHRLLPASRTMSVAHCQGAAARDRHLRLCTCSLIVPSARFLQSSDSMPASC